MISIRRATTADVPLITELGATTFDQAFRGTCTDEDLAGVLETYYNHEQVRRELEDMEDYFFVLFENEKAAGYARINLKREVESFFKDQRAAELMRIYFLNQYHGKGLANTLLQYCFDFLKSKDYKIVYLSVWEHNARAQAFYYKHGFENTGIQNPFPLGGTPQMDYWFSKKL